MPSSNATGEVAAALIVASAHYTDPKLTKLRSTAADADRLGRVLADSQIGGYRVSVVRDQPSHVVSLAIERFFKNRRRDDRLLLYMSCHGVKDDSGRLSFATTNTQLSYLGSTAVSAEFVREQMDKSDSRRIVLILDCCYSGAFARGTRLKAADRRIEIKERFDGHGRAVLTASSAMEYAFELPGGKTSGNDEPSIYTSVLVKGLETGSADLNQDGIVTVQELADYVSEQIGRQTAKQTPRHWLMDMHGQLRVARNPFPRPRPRLVVQPSAVTIDPKAKDAGARRVTIHNVGDGDLQWSHEGDFFAVTRDGDGLSVQPIGPGMRARWVRGRKGSIRVQSNGGDATVAVRALPLLWQWNRGGVLLLVAFMIATAVMIVRAPPGRDGASGAGALPVVAARGGVYRTAITSFAFTGGFDPTSEDMTTGFSFYNALLRTLVSYKPTAGVDGTRLQPDLAEAMPQVTPDGLIYTFRLRPNVRFGPPLNRAVTARDVEYAFERINTASLAAQYGVYYFGVVKGMDGTARAPAPISGIDTPDARTIRFHLTRPTGDFLYRLSMPATAPIPAEVAKCFPKAGEYGRFVISSGPYMIAGSDRLDISSCSSMRPIAGFDPARRLQLVRNPNHDQATDRLRANLVDGIQVVVKPSVASILQDVEAGRLDGSLADEPFERAMRNYLSDPTKFRHLHVDSANKTMFLSMNLTRPPFDDVHVRRAVNYALDKVAIQRAWGGPSFGQIARHILPPTLLHGRLVGYDPYRSAAGEDSGDLARAKAEMRRSRYDRDHDGLCDAPACRRLTLLNRDQRPWTAVEPIAVARLARIGIIVTPRRLPILAYMATVTTPKKAIPIVIAPLWSADYLDPYNFVSAVFSGTSILPDSNVNVSLVGLTRTMAANLGVAWPQGRVPSVDADIDQCQGIPATTPDPRDRCWEKLERRLMEQVVPWVPLLWLNQLTISSQGMVSYDFNQFATQTSFTEVAVANRIDAATLD